MANLSEEEKKAIEIVKEIPHNHHEEIFMSEDLAIAKVLNLIEKQRKEIEELSELKVSCAAHNQIEKLQKELNEENKRCMILANNDKFKEQMIEAMAKEINKTTSEKYKIKHICEKGKCRNEECHEDDWNECIKEYFRKKVENVSITNKKSVV